MRRLPRWALLAFVVSIVVNVLAAGALVIHARQHGGIDHFTSKLGLSDPPERDYPALARERFGGLPRGTEDVIFMGDSHVEFAPLADLTTDVKQRGIGDQTVADVHAWVDQVLVTPPRRLVLLAGTNDAAQGRTPEQFAADYDALLEDVKRRAPRTEIVVLTVPPATGERATRVVAFNRALEEVVARHDVELVDAFAPLADRRGALRARFTDDSTHLNALGYARVAAGFAAAAGSR